MFCSAAPLDSGRPTVDSAPGESPRTLVAVGNPRDASLPPSPAAVMRLTLLHDETVASIARALEPRDPVARRALAEAIVAANPELFPEGKPAPLKAGTKLLVPQRPRPEPGPRAARPRPPGPAPAQPAVARKEAPQPSPRPPPTKEPEVFPREKLAALEQKIAQLREAQAEINNKLASLEAAVETLRRSLLALLDAIPLTPPPIPPVAAAPLPPTAPEPRTPWMMWAGSAVGALLLAFAGFFFGRRLQARAVLAEHEARIDALLHEARQAAGPLLDLRVRPAAPRPPTSPAPAPVPPRPQQPEAPPAEPRLEEELAPPAFPDIPLEPPPPGAPAAEPPPAEAPRAEQPRLELRQEMDLALDSARSMFTDVDRFIALGRIQNAISLLEFQIHRDPNDRDSWVKLMAVYRQEGMESEFQRTFAEFRRRFPDEV